jgi:hypothetical protein
MIDNVQILATSKWAIHHTMKQVVNKENTDTTPTQQDTEKSNDADVTTNTDSINTDEIPIGFVEEGSSPSPFDSPIEALMWIYMKHGMEWDVTAHPRGKNRCPDFELIVPHSTSWCTAGERIFLEHKTSKFPSVSEYKSIVACCKEEKRACIVYIGMPGAHIQCHSRENICMGKTNMAFVIDSTGNPVFLCETVDGLATNNHSYGSMFLLRRDTQNDNNITWFFPDTVDARIPENNPPAMNPFIPIICGPTGSIMCVGSTDPIMETATFPGIISTVEKDIQHGRKRRRNSYQKGCKKEFGQVDFKKIGIQISHMNKFGYCVSVSS